MTLAAPGSGPAALLRTQLLHSGQPPIPALSVGAGATGTTVCLWTPLGSAHETSAMVTPTQSNRATSRVGEGLQSPRCHQHPRSPVVTRDVRSSYS